MIEVFVMKSLNIVKMNVEIFCEIEDKKDTIIHSNNTIND